MIYQEEECLQRFRRVFHRETFEVFLLLFVNQLQGSSEQKRRHNHHWIERHSRPSLHEGFCGMDEGPRRRSETLIQEIHNSSTFPQHREKRRVVGDQVPRRTMRGHRSLISRAEPPSVHENRSSMAHYKSSKNIAVNIAE